MLRSEISCFQPILFLFFYSMCLDSNDDMKAVLLAQVESQENIFVPSKWQHLVLTYLQQSQGKKNNHGKISIWISGQRFETFLVNTNFSYIFKFSLS